MCARWIRRPIEEVVWYRDGVPYLRPEVQLLLKARGRRPKDQRDFDNTLPLLDPPSLAWLGTSLASLHPEHRWLAALERG